MSAKKVLFILAVIAFFFFVYYSYLVSKETFTKLDFNTTVKIQDRIPRKWDFPFSLLSILGSAEITSLIWFILFLFVLVKKHFLTLVSLILFPLGLFAEIFGKIFLQHPGPPYLFYRGVVKFTFPSHYVQTEYSYPSGHMFRTTFLVVFLLLFLQFKVSLLKRIFIQVGLILLLLAMSVSRIYLGEHWMSDVIGGTLLGSSLATIAAITIPFKKKLKQGLPTVQAADQ